MNKDMVLFYCPQMEGLGREIKRIGGDSVSLGAIDWEIFPDGMPNLKIQDVERMRQRDVVFLASFDTLADIFQQLAVIYAIPRYGAYSLQVVLPYFPGTMERVDVPGQIATAKTLTRMLSCIPLCRGSGPAEIVTFDIHALQEWFYFSDDVVVRLETAIPLLQQQLERMDNIAITFPDEGAWKRFGRMFEGRQHIICRKQRIGDQRKVAIVEGDPKGKHVVIVDDLVQTGGTLIACQSALTARGAQAVSCYVTHGVFPQESWRKFIGSGFENFWITDSCPKTAQAVKGQKPFTVLSLANLISPRY